MAALFTRCCGQPAQEGASCLSEGCPRSWVGLFAVAGKASGCTFFPPSEAGLGAASCPQRLRRVVPTLHLLLQYCMNQCNGHGTCLSGFCKCDPGWFGQDCAYRVAGTAWAPGGLAVCRQGGVALPCWSSQDAPWSPGGPAVGRPAVWCPLLQRTGALLVAPAT